MKDIRVYAIDIDQYDEGNILAEMTSPLELTNRQFVEEAERQGYVWTLRELEHLVNTGHSLSTESYIRILNVNSISQ